MNFKKMFGYNTADIGNDNEYRLYVTMTISITIASALAAMYYFTLNSNIGVYFLFPVIVGIITTAFIIGKRLKGGFKLW
jgi:hypothetical protein